MQSIFIVVVVVVVFFLVCVFFLLCSYVSCLFACLLLQLMFYYSKHRVEICVRLHRICNRLSTSGKPT
jgi:hypothetical protein